MVLAQDVFRDRDNVSEDMIYGGINIYLLNTVAFAEALFGQLYIAVLLAKLVATHISGKAGAIARAKCQCAGTIGLSDRLRLVLTRLLPVQGETQENVIAFQPFLGVKLMQPLGDKRYILIADFFAPEHRRPDARRLGLEIAE